MLAGRVSSGGAVEGNGHAAVAIRCAEDGTRLVASLGSFSCRDQRIVNCIVGRAYHRVLKIHLGDRIARHRRWR